MIVGYGRVSTNDQNLDSQIERLEVFGCERIFHEKYSGKTAKDREELSSAIGFVREGDMLVVTKLDRLARSAADLGRIAEELQEKNVDLAVIDQNIDTSTPTGRLMFNMIGHLQSLSGI